MQKDLKNNIPNFLIVGAAKSGTTSVSYYLERHDEVFMATPKEPKHFSYNYAKYTGPGDVAFTQKKATKTLKDYFKLFDKSQKFKCIGEASVDNLYYHDKVIPDIKKHLGDPKIIILLRHPVDRAISAYSHLVRDDRENLTFEEALEIENSRLEKGYEFIWGYKQCGFYHDQVKSYIDSFSNVKICFFEDLVSSPQETINEITDFLSISRIPIDKDLRLNISGKPKNKIINSLISRDTILRRSLARLVGKDLAIRIKSTIQKNNLEKIEISSQLKADLNACFLEDYKKLEELLDKDLAHWVKKY